MTRASLLIALCLTSCSAVVGDYEATGLAGGEGVSTLRLCAIERDAFAYDVDLTSDAQEADVESYYELANPELADHLATLADDYAMSATRAGVTYVMGAAGVGKSFALRNLVGFDDADKCEVELKELFASPGSLSFDVVDVPDLATVDGGLVFNTLRTIDVPTSFDLSTFLSDVGCDATGTLTPVILIDDLDEIHVDAATTILAAIDQYIIDGAAGAGPFLQFVVAGRPEAFSGWLSDPSRSEDNNAILDPFLLEPPRYETAGALELRVRGYLEFSSQLAMLEASGELDATITSVSTSVASNPFLTYSMGNLAIGNVVIERTRPGVADGQQALKTRLFDDILLRATQTHGRPDAGGSEGPAYVRLLEDIAVRYIDVDDAGVFEVFSGDELDVYDDAGAVVGRVRVRDVLDRAGVALLATPFVAATRYRFEPFWLHGHLVERFNLRTVPGYTYQPCP